MINDLVLNNVLVILADKMVFDVTTHIGMLRDCALDSKIFFIDTQK